MRRLNKLFTKPLEATLHPPRLPHGLRVYAVGDIHGRLDLLQQLHEKIAADYAAANTSAIPLIIYLGDYIDRGAASREVIDYLLSDPTPAMWRIFLKGNHEAALLTFHEQPDIAEVWLTFGGQATLQSYGITPPALPLTPETTATLHTQLQQHVPPAHWHFYKTLKAFHQLGDYLFVHAGIDPDALADRDEEILLWIREPFLSAKHFGGLVVVHGHTVHPTPQLLPHRLGIDTGAYATGTLTAVVLEGQQQYCLQTMG